MKVVLSARVEADIARQLEYGIRHFGHAVAERTFARVEAFIFERVAARPHAGKYIEERGSTRRGSSRRRSLFSVA
jgi:plasmid stabilization system protein ParE